VPILVVLYNGKDNWEGELDIKSLVSSVPPELEPFIPVVKVLCIRLNQFDKRNLPGKPETQAVVEAMIRATEGTFVAGLESVIGRFRGSSLDRRIFDLIADIFCYCDWVEEVTPDKMDEVIKKVIEGREGIKMSQAVRKGIWTTGYESGVADGVASGGARTIIQVLSHRFQTVPKSVEKKVYAIKSVDQLDQLTGQAVSCQSIAEFAESLKPPKKIGR
jgi:hypothetical protein